MSTTTIHVLTTYNAETRETDTAGAFTDLNDAKRAAQEAYLSIQEANALTKPKPHQVTNPYRVFVEQWHGTDFEGQRHIGVDTDNNGYLRQFWYYQPAGDTAPHKEGGLV